MECWKCDVCGFKWIKGEVWPEQCSRKACRSRKWNKGAVQDEAAEPVAVEAAAESKPSLSDLRAVVAALERKPVDAVQPVAAVVQPCPFTTWSEVDGENYACGLAAHDWKVKHGAWIKL